MMENLREEVLEYIAVALVETRPMAQPRDLAALRELELDAKDAESEDQLRAILGQAQNLRAFCEDRKVSTDTQPASSRSFRPLKGR